MSRNPRPLRASDLAELGFCEMKVLLKARHGDQTTPEAAEARRGGLEEHERFHQQVTKEHNRTVDAVRGAETDKRCFIATAVYGGTDPRTQQLRSYRDSSLNATWWGRALVQMYYAVSPHIVPILLWSPMLRRSVAAALDHLRRRIAPADSKEAGNDPEQAEASRQYSRH